MRNGKKSLPLLSPGKGDESNFSLSLSEAQLGLETKLVFNFN
jgi:hypothetical protein